MFALGDDLALVQTLDFFTPIVDDPDAYGAIAAANALSDVYAMGGQPITALAIAAFPLKGFDPADMKAIFAGGARTLDEAGVALLGGHTVQDTEVKFGYAVTGTVRPGAIWTNAGARPADALFLTKPLGTGIITTAAKLDRAPDRALRAAIETMSALNRDAARALLALGGGVVHACTDITGFGFAGHGCEMALASGATLVVDVASVPILPDVVELASRNRSGGLATNQQYFGDRVSREGGIEGDLEAVLFDPQTSGGLLVAVSPDRAGDVEAALARAGVTAWRVGEVATAGDAAIRLLGMGRRAG